MEQHNLSLNDLKDLRGVQKAKRPGQSFNLVYRKNDESFEMRPLVAPKPPRQIMHTDIQIKYSFDDNKQLVGYDTVNHSFRSGNYRILYVVKGDTRKLKGYNMEIKFYDGDDNVVKSIYLDDILNVYPHIVISTNYLLVLEDDVQYCHITITGGKNTGLYVECWLRIFIRQLNLNIIEDLNLYLDVSA